jgi:hypothetical protein
LEVKTFKGVDVKKVDARLKKQVKEKVDSEDFKPVRIYAHSISRNGLMKITFNQELNVPELFKKLRNLKS